VVDRYSKKVGKIKDLLINPISYLVEYIVAGNDYLIPTSLIDNDDSTQKVITLSQMKEELTSWKLKSSFPKNFQCYTKMKSTIAYDFAGDKLGPIENIAYHTGLRVDLLIGKKGDDLFGFLTPDYFVVPTENICQFSNKFAVLCIPKDELKVINLTGFEHLFAKTRQSYGNKKRYVIVEAPVTTISFYLKQREEILQEVTETLFIEELDISNETKLTKFVKLFNTILATSPDTYIPLSKDDAKRYFKCGTFLVHQAHQIIGYSHVCIGNHEKADERVGAIAGIGVHPLYRGKYIALALIDRCLKYLIENQVDKIQADIYELNIPSLKLFSSLGFHEVGETFLV
jgi:ribosomal protein S18 acetylase RimI-like enzyme